MKHVYTSNITTKGQITIPKSLRDSAGFDYGKKVKFIVDDDSKEVKIEPTGGISESFGKFAHKANKSKTGKEREFMEDNYGKE